jgi:hypothetical protein
MGNMKFLKSLAILAILLLPSQLLAGAMIVDPLWAGIFDNSGQPLASGQVFSYAAGTMATKSLYLDRGETSAAPNPVILDANGRAIVYGDGAYKLIIEDVNNVTLYSVDNFWFQDPSSASYAYLAYFSADAGTIGSLTSNGFVGNGAQLSSSTWLNGYLLAPIISQPTISSGTYNNQQNFNGPTLFSNASNSFITVQIGYASITTAVGNVASFAQLNATFGTISSLSCSFSSNTDAENFEIKNVGNPINASDAIPLWYSLGADSGMTAVGGTSQMTISVGSASTQAIQLILTNNTPRARNFYVEFKGYVELASGSGAYDNGAILTMQDQLNRVMDYKIIKKPTAYDTEDLDWVTSGIETIPANSSATISLMCQVINPGWPNGTVLKMLSGNRSFIYFALP